MISGDGLMSCAASITYTILPGDNLYHLSKHYKTSVPAILAMNPKLDPYNMQVGSAITICPGEGYIQHGGNPNPPSCPNWSKQLSLVNNMRLAWEQHVYWTRMLIISIAARLPDLKATETRLLRNPADIADIYVNYYPADVSRQIGALFTDHLVIGGKLLTALRDGKTKEAADLNKQWYANADQIADYLSKINPFYNHAELQKMMKDHLDLTSKEAGLRFAGNYPEDIEAFNMIEHQALMMADYFTSGLMKQFPQNF